MIGLTTQQIKYFLSAAKTLSFTKTAEECYTSQPTISRQIAYMEEELGFTLFYRENNQLRLTPGGLVMLAEFSRQESSLRAARRRVAQIQSGAQGHLSIAYLTGLDTDDYVYPPTLAFAQRYPGISISLDSGSFNTLRSRLVRGEYDIVFTYSFQPMPDCLSQMAYRCGCSLITSAHHPIAEKGYLATEDLLDQTIIFPAPMDSSPNIRNLFMRCFGMSEAEAARINIRSVDTQETKQFLVRSGTGVALSGNCMQYIYDSRYAMFPLEGETLEISAYWMPDNLNPTIPLYLQCFQQQLDESHLEP